MAAQRETERTAVSTRSRCYVFTINNYDKMEVNVIPDLQAKLKERAKYFVMGKEVGEQGTPHLQGFVWFKNQLVFNTVKEIFSECRAHIEVARGTAFQAATYCKKDGNFEEWGVPPVSQGEKGELGAIAQKEKWSEIRDLAKEGKMSEILEQYPREGIASYRTLKMLRHDFRPVPDTLQVLDNYWFYGLSGAGKTRRVEREFPGYYDHLLDKWWDDYDGEETVLYDDIGPWNKELGTELKRIAGNKPARVQIKGTSTLVRPKRIVVTSQYRIDDIWDIKDQATRDAIHRRFKEIEVVREEEEEFWDDSTPPRE